MASLGTPALTFPPHKWNGKSRTQTKFVIRAVSKSNHIEEDELKTQTKFVITAVSKSNPIEEDELKSSSFQNPAPNLQQTICSLPPINFLMKNVGVSRFAIGLCLSVTLLIVGVRVYVKRKSRSNQPGSVADLVRRGQLNYSSDRRGISRGLKYEDPFNNPMVKMDVKNSSVEMCGKKYRLEPVTLTREEQAIHQKRRSRAYQWKRPTIFLKEGDQIPPDVDPDTVRWIPANHPFATTVTDIDEQLAQNNVYQKRGVPFRIQAEHQALQAKLQALQSDKKLKDFGIDPVAAKDFERQFKSNPLVDNQRAKDEAESKPTTMSDRTVGNDEEMQKP